MPSSFADRPGPLLGLRAAGRDARLDFGVHDHLIAVAAEVGQQSGLRQVKPRQGRTVYVLTCLEERQRANQPQRHARQEEAAAALAQARERLTARTQAKARGKEASDGEPPRRSTRPRHGLKTLAQRASELHYNSQLKD